MRSDQPHRLPNVRPTTVRLDDALRAELEAEAARRGLTTSELTRQALVMVLAWFRIIRLMEAGATPEHAADPELMRDALTRLADTLEDEAKRQGK